MPEQDHEVTALLERVRHGDKAAENRMYEIVMPQLRRIAQGLLNAERPNHTLRGTELVNRMYLRLAGKELALNDRAHFFAIAARAMRWELIDYARKRPNVAFFQLDGLPEHVLRHTPQLDLAIMIDQLLDELAEAMPLRYSILQLKLCLGMTEEEVAEILAIPLRTVQLRSQEARIWLYERAEQREWKPAKKRASAADA